MPSSAERAAQVRHPVVQSRERNYLLVVTHKELYLGNGATFYESIVKEKVEEIIGQYGNQLIPSETCTLLP
jgi:hypothetical protein